MKFFGISIAAIITIIVLGAGNAWATQGWTIYAVPQEIVTTGDGGIVVHGAFGNPGSCATSNQVIVKGNTNQLKLVEAMAMTALVAQREMKFYVTGCDNSFDNIDMGLADDTRYATMR